MHEFDNWLQQWGWSLSTAVDDRDADAEFLAKLLVQYGRELYYAGKPYGRFSETINGISARRPAFRRQLTQAWDLAYAWVADELTNLQCIMHLFPNQCCWPFVAYHCSGVGHVRLPFS